MKRTWVVVLLTYDSDTKAHVGTELYGPFATKAAAMADARTLADMEYSRVQVREVLDPNQDTEAFA